MSRVTLLAVGLALVSVAGAVDLTSFRPSYARVTTSDFYVSASSDINSRSSPDSGWQWSEIGLAPGWSWFTQVKSDTVELTCSEYLGFRWRGSHYVRENAEDVFDYLELSEALELDWYQYIGRSDFLLGLTGDFFGGPSLLSDSRHGRMSKGISGDAGLEVGAGYGHFRDAWPLAKAVRLTGILRDNGVLAHEPSSSELLEIADFISRSWKLFYIHDRTARFYYDSLETYLLKTGTITGPLPAYVLMRLDDRLMVGSDGREFGSRVFAGVSASGYGEVHYRQDSRNDTMYLDRYGYWFLDPFIAYRLARPFGLRWTTGAELRYELGLGDEAWRHSLHVAFGGAYQISNRLLAQAWLNASPTFCHNIKPFANSALGVSASLSAGLGYYLTDRLRLSVSAGGDYRRDPPSEESWPPAASLFFQLSLDAGPEWSFGSVPGGLRPR